MHLYWTGIAPGLRENFQSHTHQRWEIVLNLEGTGINKIGGETFSFYPGSIICIPPYVEHSKWSETAFKDIFFQADEFVLPSGQQVVQFTDDEEKSIETLMMMTLRLFYKNGNRMQYVADSLLHTMHEILISWSKNPFRDERVERFKNELIQNFTDPEFDLLRALQNTSYSADYFRRLFRESTEQTPSEYLNALRINYAKKMLLQRDVTHSSIAEIAVSAGFYDPRYFSRVFKQHTGFTPTDYVLQLEQTMTTNSPPSP